jgi:hypothetical protein
MSSACRHRQRPTWQRWLLVLVCCAVSLTAPFDMDTVAEVLAGCVPSHLSHCMVSNADDNDPDEDNLLRPTSGPDFRCDVRKQPRLPGPVPPTQARPGFRCSARSHPGQCLVTRAGGEHAFRNGCGAPLLC